MWHEILYTVLSLTVQYRILHCVTGDIYWNTRISSIYSLVYFNLSSLLSFFSFPFLLQVPYPYGDFLYYSKTEKGKSYKIYCRKPLVNISAMNLGESSGSSDDKAKIEGEQVSGQYRL